MLLYQIYIIMGTFIERLEEEKRQLDEKIKKLNAFLSSDKVNEIDRIQVTLLNIQIKAMESYSQCLLERLVRLQ